MSWLLLPASISAQNPTICAVITSLLAGDVYKPAMWQALITKEGFSNVTDVGSMPTARSSRQVRLEKPLA